jgi:transaldolase
MKVECDFYTEDKIGLHQLFELVDPSFDRKRLVMKVAATWEGLQACRELKMENIKTLATTVFTMEQVVLAGEVGCVSISPFVHELKAVFDET